MTLQYGIWAAPGLGLVAGRVSFGSVDDGFDDLVGSVFLDQMPTRTVTGAFGCASWRYVAAMTWIRTRTTNDARVIAASSMGRRSFVRTVPNMRFLPQEFTDVGQHGGVVEYPMSGEAMQERRPRRHYSLLKAGLEGLHDAVFSRL